MRKEKQLLLDEVKEQIDQYGSFVVMRYSGLKANKATEFRRAVRGLGGNVEVMRKRILRKAAATAGIDFDEVPLKGHIGLVYGGLDPLETAKYIVKFSQENEQAIEIIGGRFDEKMYNGADVAMLSQLPSKNEMRAQLLGLFEAPMAQLLAVMDALLTSVPHCLQNKIEKCEECSADGKENNSLTEVKEV